MSGLEIANVQSAGGAKTRCGGQGCWRFLTGINDSGRSYPKTVKNLAFRHKKGREVDGLLPFVCEWVQKLYLAVKSSSMP